MRHLFCASLVKPLLCLSKTPSCWRKTVQNFVWRISWFFKRPRSSHPPFLPTSPPSTPENHNHLSDFLLACSPLFSPVVELTAASVVRSAVKYPKSDVLRSGFARMPLMGIHTLKLQSCVRTRLPPSPPLAPFVGIHIPRPFYRLHAP